MSKEGSSQTAAEALESVVTFLRRSLMFWKRSIVAFVVVALAAIPGVFMKARIWRSETIVLYQDNIKAAEIIGGGDSGENARRVGARLREMLMSRASLEPIVKEFPRYAKLADRRGMVDAVEELRSHISFKAREGDTFEIGYEAPDPEEARDVTARLGDRIVQEAASRRAEQSKATKEYLEAQSEQNKAKLRAAETEMQNFLVAHPDYLALTLPPGVKVPGVTTPGAVPVPPGTKDPVLFQMEAEAHSIERQLRGSKGGDGVQPAPEPVESPEVAAARKDLADKRALYTDQHPDVVAARRRLQAALDADAKKAPPTPAPTPGGDKLSEADRKVLELKLANLRRAIAERRAANGPATPGAPSAAPGASPTSAGSEAVALEVEFRRLQREVAYLKEAQRMLDDKLFKAGLNAGANMSDRNIQVSILDPAYLPTHASSKPRSTMLAVYIAIAVILAMLVALISARLDDRIYQKGDLEVLDLMPVVGVIPRSVVAGAAPTQRRRKG